MSKYDILVGKLKDKGVRDPGALAAWIGRKKLGKKKFQQIALSARMKGK